MSKPYGAAPQYYFPSLHSSGEQSRPLQWKAASIELQAVKESF
jgi:hypothetical protein